MATITLNLDERTIRNGMAQVRIRISHKRTNCFIGSGVWVEPQYFIGSSLYDPVSRRAQAAAEKRERISEQVRQIENYLKDVDRGNLATITANDIRDHCGLGKTRVSSTTNDFLNVNRAKTEGLRTKNITNRIVGSNADFMQWMGRFGESKVSAKTRESYNYGWKVLLAYCRSLGLHTLTFDDIDYARLTDYARWLRSEGYSDATRHMMESYVRAAYKEAQKRRMVSRENDPYYDYSIAPVPPKDIETLTAKEMHALMMCEPKLKGLQRARDLALMSFMLCGANLLDVYLMNEPKRGEVSFVRHKIETRSQREIHIRVEPELKALVDRHKGDGAMLRFRDEFPNYESFRHKISHRLNELSGELGFDVSLSKIRRTWATIAASLGVQEWVIDKSMGHIDSTVTRRHYVKYDWNQTAEANRKVIDYVLNA